MIRVLVYEFASGGGFGDVAPPPSILAEGRAMRDALTGDLVGIPAVKVLAAGQAVLPPAEALLPDCDEAAADFVRRAAASADAVWLVTPESEGVALELARVVEATGVAMLGSRSGAIELAASKSRTLGRLSAAGLRTVPAWPLHSAPLAEHEEWVVKPDVGCGCENMRRVSSATAQRLREHTPPAMIAQPWIEGEASSLSLLVAGSRVELLAVNRQHIAVGPDGAIALTGISRRGDLPVLTRAALADLATKAIAQIPGLAGYVGIDFVLAADGEAVLLEVNARLTSAYVGLSAYLGRNIARDVLAARLPGQITDG
jgi:tyramine---L-glutamate ligase